MKNNDKVKLTVGQLKRLIKESKLSTRFVKEKYDRDNVRVLSFGIDVVVPNDMDASSVESLLENEANRLFRDKIRIAATEFKRDVTDLYARDYSNEMFI